MLEHDPSYPILPKFPMTELSQAVDRGENTPLPLPHSIEPGGPHFPFPARQTSQLPGGKPTTPPDSQYSQDRQENHYLWYGTFFVALW